MSVVLSIQNCFPLNSILDSSQPTFANTSLAAAIGGGRSRMEKCWGSGDDGESSLKHVPGDYLVVLQLQVTNSLDAVSSKSCI